MRAHCERGGILARIAESMLRGRWRRRHWRVGLQAVVGRGWSTSSERGERRSGFGRRGGERGDHGRAVAERDPGGDDRSDRWASVGRERSGAQASVQLRGARLTGGPPCQSGARVAGEWERGSAGAGLRERAERGSWAAARGPVRERGRRGMGRSVGRERREGLGCNRFGLGLSCWFSFPLFFFKLHSN